MSLLNCSRGYKKPDRQKRDWLSEWFAPARFKRKKPKKRARFGIEVRPYWTDRWLKYKFYQTAEARDEAFKLVKIRLKLVYREFRKVNNQF